MTGQAIGMPEAICCHTFRATGITAYLENGGTIEHAQQIANHESPKTTNPVEHARGFGEEFPNAIQQGRVRKALPDARTGAVGERRALDLVRGGRSSPEEIGGETGTCGHVLGAREE